MHNREIPIIEVQNVSKRFIKEIDIITKLAGKIGFDVKNEIVHAVDSVNLAIVKNEILGLAGESGCGKSTLGWMIAGLLEPSEGIIYFMGKHINKISKNEKLKLQMIFQNPFSSLNPRMRVGNMIAEAPRFHKLIKSSELEEYVENIMIGCGLDPSFKNRYPHQFSGGQQQRIAIARALAVKPKFIIADEVVSALDVSIQAQILNLLMQIRYDFGLSILFISHDLGVIKYMCDRVAVMYLGKVVEIADNEELFKNPLHPYTKMLLEASPDINKRDVKFTKIIGELPSSVNPPEGCYFHPRCLIAYKNCRLEKPVLKEFENNHYVACFRI